VENYIKMSVGVHIGLYFIYSVVSLFCLVMCTGISKYLLVFDAIFFLNFVLNILIVVI